MINISSNTWNKAGFSVVRGDENDNSNKTLLRLLCICDLNKRWGGKNIYDLVGNKIKGKQQIRNERTYKTANQKV